MFSLADGAIVAGAAALLYEPLLGVPAAKAALIPADTNPPELKLAGVEITPRIGDPTGILNGNNAMRETEAGGWMVRSSSRAPMHAQRLGTGIIGAAALGVTLAIGLVMTAGAARAGDDDVDQRSFSERFVDSYHSMIRGTTMDNRGIDYRERSPLVVPPSLDLPPPAAGSSPANVTNWPKDPDERQRKAIIAAKKKNAPPPAPVAVAAAPSGAETSPVRPINIAPPVPEPVAPAPARPAYANDTNGTARTDPVYDQPGDLFRGGATALVPSGVSESLGLDKLGLDKLDIGNLFGSKKADATALPPGTEPAREALTQPPAGYQAPSPNYPYAVQSKGIFSGEANPDRNPAAAASSASSVVH